MISAEEQNHEHVEEAFETMTGSPYRYVEVEYLVARGDLRYETSSWDAGPVSDDDLEANPQSGAGTGSETARHVQYKIKMARYLDKSGYDIPKATPDDAPPAYDCFERDAGGLNSDVVLDLDDGLLAGEVGYTPAKYLLRAFGYTTVATPGDLEAIDSGDLFRSKRSPVKIFVSRPYKSDKFHIFHAVDLAEPDLGRMSDELTDLLD